MIQNRSQKKLTPLKLLFVFMGASLIFTSISCTNRKKDDGKIFHYSLKDEIKTLDSVNAYDSVSLDVVGNLFDTLYQYNYFSKVYELQPLLANGMPSYSKDAKTGEVTVTIKIKQGVHFQDEACFKTTQGKGRELIAEDFIYAFKRHAIPSIESQGSWIFEGKVVGYDDFKAALLKASSNPENKTELNKLFEAGFEGFKALDHYTLQIKLKKPYPQLMYILAMPFTSPVAREAVEAYADTKGNLLDHPVVTGPYKLVRWDRGNKVVIEKNPNHATVTDTWPSDGSAYAGKQLPFLDKIEWQIIKEEQPRWLQFQKGQIDLFAVSKDNLSSALANKTELVPELKEKSIQLSTLSGGVFYWIQFNQKDKLLQNKFLRQAISSLMDRELWIKTFLDFRGDKQVTALPPGVRDRVQNASIKYDFNIERSKELLKKAGYPEGKGLPVINFDFRGADSVSRQLSEFMTKQFSQVGIKINAVLNTFPAYLEKAKGGQLQISLGGWQMDYPDAENVYQLLYGPNGSPGPNDANYNNPEFNKLYEQMALMESGPEREAIVKKLDEILQEETPWALGYYLNEYHIHQNWLKNYHGMYFIQNQYKYLDIDLKNKEDLAKKFK
jgi:ABC-type transport system substrate-binding protein